MKWTSVVSFASLLLGLLGCDEEKPYTPFQIATSLPDEEAPPLDVQANDVKEGQAREPQLARRAPQNSSTWKVFGRQLEAPGATHLHSAIPAPAGKPGDLLLWALPRPKAEGAPEAGVWLFEKNGKKQQLQSLPDYLPRGSDCRYEASLENTGDSSISARVSASCEARLLPGTPTESLFVLSPEQPSPVLMHFRLQHSAPGEALSVVVDSHDRDADGRDDVELQLSLTSPSGTKETLPLRWLLRAAGASRQAGSPGKELASRASRLMTASVRKKERAEVPAQVEALKRLLAAICSEFATQKLEAADGAGIPCGDQTAALSRLHLAEVQSHVGEKDPESALGALERSSWFGRKVGEREEKAMSQAILKVSTSHRAKRLARFEVPTQKDTVPFGHPLHFSADGQLWAKTPNSKTKRLTMKGDPPLVTPASEGQEEVRIEAPTWEFTPVGQANRKLTSALPSCQRSEVQLAFSRSGGAPLAPVPVPLLAPRPGNCRTFTGTQLEARPLYWEGGRLSLILGGQLVSTAGHKKAPPFPIAWGSSLGVAIRKGNTFELWTGDITKGLHHCAVSPGVEKVACVRGESVIVLTRAEP